jgi:hypothetical protein
MQQTMMATVDEHQPHSDPARQADRLDTSQDNKESADALRAVAEVSDDVGVEPDDNAAVVTDGRSAPLAAAISITAANVVQAGHRALASAVPTSEFASPARPFPLARRRRGHPGSRKRVGLNAHASRGKKHHRSKSDVASEQIERVRREYMTSEEFMTGYLQLPLETGLCNAVERRFVRVESMLLLVQISRMRICRA